MSHRWASIAVCLLAFAAVASAQGGDMEARLKALEQGMQRVQAENAQLKQDMEYMKAHGGKTKEDEIRMQALEEQVAAQKASGPRAPAPAGAIGLNPMWVNDGFWLKSDNGDFQFHPGGDVEAESRNFVSEQRSNNNFFLREARLKAEGTLYHDYGFMVVADFGKSAAALKQAWAEWKRYPYLSFRMGEVKKPFSLESLTDSLNIDFAERSPAKILTNEYEIGAEVYGTTWEKRVGYTLAVVNGGPENSVDTKKPKDIVGHLTLDPFAPCDDFWTKGIHVGGSVAYGAEKQTFTSMSTQDSGTTFLTAAANNRIVDQRTQWNVEGAWCVGPAKVQGEGTWVNQGMDHFVAPTSSLRTNIGFSSWYVEGLCVVTGEDAVMGRRHPKTNFLCDGGLGEVELAFRYGRFDVGEDIFRDGFATKSNATTGSTDGFDNYIGGVNWWFNPNVRLTVDFFHTDWDEAVVLDHEHYTHEEGVLTRFQIDW